MAALPPFHNRYWLESSLVQVRPNKSWCNSKCWNYLVALRTQSTALWLPPHWRFVSLMCPCTPYVSPPTARITRPPLLCSNHTFYAYTFISTLEYTNAFLHILKVLNYGIIVITTSWLPFSAADILQPNHYQLIVWYLIAGSNLWQFWSLTCSSNCPVAENSAYCAVLQFYGWN